MSSNEPTSVVTGLHDYLKTTTAPDLTAEFRSIEKYLPIRALTQARVAMPLLAVHPLTVRSEQLTLGGQTGGVRETNTQIAVDILVNVTNPRQDSDQERAIELAELVEQKLRANHTWAAAVTGGGLAIDGAWLVDPISVYLDGAGVLIWRWETPGMSNPDS